MIKQNATKHYTLMGVPLQRILPIAQVLADISGGEVRKELEQLNGIFYCLITKLSMFLKK
jgi:hypothetical protein